VRGLFVTGTDTGAGKTLLSAALLAAMAAAGESVRAHKPVVTGLDDEPPADWPRDHELLASVAGMDPREVAPLRYGPAVSPHLAAELAGQRLDPARLIGAAHEAAGGAAHEAASEAAHATPGETTRETPHARGEQHTLIVEGVGGLLVPFAEDFTVRDLAVALGLPLLIAARPGLGTINHTLLTLHAARAAGLEVAAVVLTPWPDEPSALERSNRETIARLGEVEVEVLATVAHPQGSDLRAAGERLPWRRWLAHKGPVAGQS
jgi:dethiobiotin synthetase